MRRSTSSVLCEFEGVEAPVRLEGLLSLLKVLIMVLWKINQYRLLDKYNPLNRISLVLLVVLTVLPPFPNVLCFSSLDLIW